MSRKSNSASKKTGRRTVKSGSAKTTQPKAPASPPQPKKRHDQVQCPKCGNFGCPADRGTRTEGFKRIQMRTCSMCKLKFDTSTHVDGRLPPQVIAGW